MQYIKVTCVNFWLHVKIASRFVQYRIVQATADHNTEVSKIHSSALHFVGVNFVIFFAELIRIGSSIFTQQKTPTCFRKTACLINIVFLWFCDHCSNRSTKHQCRYQTLTEGSSETVKVYDSFLLAEIYVIHYKSTQKSLKKSTLLKIRVAK